MGLIGCLGDIVFSVSSELIETFNNMQWSGSARWSTHDRHLSNALTEFTGIEPDKVSFDMRVSVDLGIEPMTEIAKIWTHERKGTPLSLIIGEKYYGKHKWAIESHSVKLETFDENGNLSGAAISLKLLEYLNE